MASIDNVPALIEGTARGSRPNLGEGSQNISLNNGGEIVVAQGIPSKAEMCRLGKLNTLRMASASAFMHVAAYPTTRAELVLFNGDPLKSFIIDSVFDLAITSMAAAGSIALLAQIVPSAAVPVDDSSQLITVCTGANYGGSGKRAVAQTTAIANKWELLAPSFNGGGATAQIGLAAYAEVWGKLIIPPGSMLALNLVAGTAAGTSILGVTWFEAILNLQ